MGKFNVPDQLNSSAVHDYERCEKCKGEYSEEN